MAGLARHLWGACAADGVHCNVYGIDLSGHGETWEREGGGGGFTMDRWVEQVAYAADFVRTRTADSAVIVVGAGTGGDVAFHAMQASKKITAAVCNGLLLSSEIPMPRPGARLLRGWIGETLEILLHGWPVFTPALVGSQRSYDKVVCDGGMVGSASDCHAVHDAALYAQRVVDPLCK